MLLGLAWWTRWERIHLQCERYGFDPWVGKIPLQEEMVTHSSLLAGKTPWTEKPGGLLSMGHKESDTTERAHNNKGLANQPDAGWSQYISHSGLVHHRSLGKVWLWKGVNTGNTTAFGHGNAIVAVNLVLPRETQRHSSVCVSHSRHRRHSQPTGSDQRGKCGGPLSTTAKEGMKTRKLYHWGRTLAYTLSLTVKQICSWALQF